MEKETRSNRVGDPFSASSVGGETMATELTELPKEMRGSRLDQSKLKTKVDLGLAEQMAVLKSQVDQFEQLVLSMGNKIKGMSRVDSCGGASDTSSIYIYYPEELVRGFTSLESHAAIFPIYPFRCCESWW